jgi:SAM-dependent methyltransferase
MSADHPFFAQTMRALNEVLQRHYAEHQARNWRVLEAGGGSFSHFALPPDSQLVALDIDHGQLARNDATALRVQADLHCPPLKPGSFDLIVCFNVIEHLNRPDDALRELAAALAPGGLLLVGCPERGSLKGWITRLTPLGVHRWFYRTIVRKQDRGGGHFDAFPTPFRPLVSHGRLRGWLATRGLEALFFQSYDGSREYGLTAGSARRRLFALPYYAVCGLGRLLTLGRWRAEQSDLLFVARRPVQA